MGVDPEPRETAAEVALTDVLAGMRAGKQPQGRLVAADDRVAAAGLELLGDQLGEGSSSSSRVSPNSTCTPASCVVGRSMVSLAMADRDWA
jgi:hypothetical protein